MIAAPGTNMGGVTYRIDPRQPIGAEIRRILRDELDGAVADLRAPSGPDAEAIHDARRRIKKARSLLRLARPHFGGGVARLANAELRDAASSIASQRDADALVESVDRLLDTPTVGDADRGALDRLRERTAEAASQHRAAGSVDASVAHGTARRLQQTNDWLQRVPARADGWDALGGGLGRQYDRGRRQLRRLGPAPSDEERHDWRKRAKDLWYHERLLRDLWPKAQKPYVRAASDLAEILGDDHDLSLVQAFVDAAPGLADDDRRVSTRVIDTRRDELLAQAQAIGVLVYADRPDAWVSRHQVWWEIRSSAPEPAGPAGGSAHR